jgi:hypothetical protein
MTDEQQYKRFGTEFGEPKDVKLCTSNMGRPDLGSNCQAGTVLPIQNFSAGNLTNRLENNKSNAATGFNKGIVDTASDPNIRALTQTMLPPVMAIDGLGNLNVNSSRVTSANNVARQFAANSSANYVPTNPHMGLDVNYDNYAQRLDKDFHSPVAGTVFLAHEGLIVIKEANTDILHGFRHGENTKDFETGDDVEVGTALGKVSNIGKGVPIYLHYEIRDGEGVTAKDYNKAPTVSTLEHWQGREIPVLVQQTLDLPNHAGKAILSVGQIDIQTTGGQNLTFDLNATNVNHMRFDSMDREFSFSAGGGLAVRVNSNAKIGELGGQVVTPEGVGIPFIHNGLKTYDDGSLMLSQPDGSIRSIEPSTNPKTGQFEWQDRVMTRSQAMAEFGADVELPPAPPTPTILPSLSPSTQTTSPAIANPSSSTKDTSNDSVSPARGSGEVWFGSDAGSAMQQQQATHFRPPGGYPMPTEAQFASNEPIRLYNQQDGTSKLYTFNSDGVPIREQQLDVNGVDINQKISPERSQQMDVAQEQSQQPQTKLSIS